MQQHVVGALAGEWHPARQRTVKGEAGCVVRDGGSVNVMGWPSGSWKRRVFRLVISAGWRVSMADFRSMAWDIASRADSTLRINASDGDIIFEFRKRVFGLIESLHEFAH